MSKIRVTYSGLISFVIGIGSLVTGLIFTLIVTRRLTPEEFGEWGLIGALTGYVLMFSPVISYWNTREIARGENSGRTSLQTSSMFSLIAILGYFLIVQLVNGSTNINVDLFLLAAIMIPMEYVKYSLTGISLGFKPQAGEYGLLVFEFVKIPSGIIFIYFLNMGVEGAIITSTLSSFASIILLLVLSRNKIRGKFNVKYLVKWARISWLPLYPKISSVFERSDITVYTILTGSVIGLAYWGAANAVAHIVNQSSKINRGLYPMLLGGGKKSSLKDNLTHVFYFAFPLTAICIVFARPALFTLNPAYEIAVPVVLAIIPVTFLRTISAIFSQALSGIERVDVNEEASLKDYIKSKLFVIPTLVNIHRGIYLAIFIIFLIIIVPLNYSELEIVMYWGIILSITQVPFTIYLYFLTRKEFNKIFDTKPIIKYIISTSIVFSVINLVMDRFLIYHIEIFNFLPSVLFYLFLSVLGYLGITYAVDQNTRKLVKAIIREIKN